MDKVKCNFCNKTTLGIVVSSGSKDNHDDCCYICENCVALCAMIILGKREKEIREREKETP
jgi:hypothetical protein